jgi:hypothetical protein
MKNKISFFFLLVPTLLQAQYYYNDIIGTQEMGNRIKAFKEARVQSVVTNGYDSRGSKTTDFNEWRDLQYDKNTLKVTTRNGQSVGRTYYQFDAAVKLVSVRDSSTGIESVTNYYYDVNGNLNNVKTEVADSLKDFTETEIRRWIYNTNGKPEQMWRIINGKDSIQYNFKTDEAGNVIEESLMRRKLPIDVVYYYYTDKNQMSDIVRYNKRVKKLLPDIMFEYDDRGRISQKITTLSTSGVPNYLIWRYIYNDKGLKAREALFNKQKELTGRMEYVYTFMQ